MGLVAVARLGLIKLGEAGDVNEVCDLVDLAVNVINGGNGNDAIIASGGCWGILISSCHRGTRARARAKAVLKASGCKSAYRCLRMGP